jgi:hypothetical protein
MENIDLLKETLACTYLILCNTNHYLLVLQGHQLSAQRSPHEVIRRSDGESIHVSAASNMHAAATANFYESNRREYTIRRADVLVPAGHVSIDGQDSLVIHNAISMDDGQVGAATSPFIIPHLLVRVTYVCASEWGMAK